MRHGQERSDDGLFTVHEEECLGVCDFAPVAQIELREPRRRQRPSGCAELIAALRDGDVPEPARGPAMESFKAASRVLAGLEEVPAS